MYKVLYRAYRPEIFDEVLGQEHIVKILKNQIALNEVNHAYLFCGTRGTGKTTVARLLAKGVNCLSDGDKPCGQCDNCKSIKEGNFMDLIEIDAASNNGVDNIRELRESVNYPPVLGKKKVYIIDEVHMLSSSAFNALLKTLEEPPEGVIFILATTEPEKLPATILSRCMRMDFRRVKEIDLLKSMKSICCDREIEIEESGLRLIVANADGSVRDGLTILDQCISGGDKKITREDVLNSLGAVGEDVYIELTEAVTFNDPSKGLLIINRLTEEGKDSRQILQGWMNHYRNILMTKFIKKPEDVLNMSVENIERVRAQSESVDLRDINHSIIEIAQTISEAKRSTQPRVLLEICMVKLATESNSGDVVVRTPLNTSKNGESFKRSESETSKEKLKIKTSQNQDEIWNAVLEAGEQEKGGNFTLVKNNARLEGINKEEFVISASGMAEAFLERERNYVSSLVEKYSGRKLTMRLVSLDKVEIEKVNENDILNTASDVIGIEVEQA